MENSKNPNRILDYPAYCLALAFIFTGALGLGVYMHTL